MACRKLFVRHGTFFDDVTDEWSNCHLLVNRYSKKVMFVLRYHDTPFPVGAHPAEAIVRYASSGNEALVSI